MSNDKDHMPILSAVVADMNRRGHGVLPLSIPMSWLNEDTAIRIHGQTLQKLKSRGGMSYTEIVCNMVNGTYEYLRKLDEYKCMVYLRKKLEDEQR